MNMMNTHAFSGKRFRNMSYDFWFDSACNNKNKSYCLPKTPVNSHLKHLNYVFGTMSI